MADQIFAGAATVNLTPWLGIALCGGFAQRQATDVHDEILARALVVESGGTRIGLVVCDFVCMPRGIADAVKQRVAQASGIPPSHVLVCATHTHSGPAVRTALGVREDAVYVESVSNKIADAVHIAVNRLRPARIGWGEVREDRISFNRRWWMRDGTVHMNPGAQHPDAVRPSGPTDPTLELPLCGRHSRHALSHLCHVCAPLRWHRLAHSPFCRLLRAFYGRSAARCSATVSVYPPKRHVRRHQQYRL